MRELGLDAFRFSVAWPRILPEGRGRGVRRAASTSTTASWTSCSRRGIRPFVNLFHWDLPQPSRTRAAGPTRNGRARSPSSQRSVAARLGDRVATGRRTTSRGAPRWLGYGLGIARARPPEQGARRSLPRTISCFRTGWAVEAIRRQAQEPRVGIILDAWPAYPASDAEADAEAARAVEALRYRFFFDGVLRGRYPDDALELLAPIEPPVRDGDMAALSRGPRLDRRQ